MNRLKRAFLMALFTAASCTALTAQAHDMDHMGGADAACCKTAPSGAMDCACCKDMDKADACACCKGMSQDGACHHTMTKGEHAGHGMVMSQPEAGDTASTRELKTANMTMHKDMDIAYTGDVDVDFLRGMIAHHQGAVEMAEIQLKYGRDPQVKRLAQDIIRAQNIEIRWMKGWLAQLEAKPLHVSDKPIGRMSWTDETWTGDDGVWLNER